MCKITNWSRFGGLVLKFLPLYWIVDSTWGNSYIQTLCLYFCTILYFAVSRWNANVQVLTSEARVGGLNVVHFHQSELSTYCFFYLHFMWMVPWVVNVFSELCPHLLHFNYTMRWRLNMGCSKLQTIPDLVVQFLKLCPCTGLLIGPERIDLSKYCVFIFVEYYISLLSVIRWNRNGHVQVLTSKARVGRLKVVYFLNFLPITLAGRYYSVGEGRCFFAW